MIGQTFGRLTVIASAPKTDRNLKWKCLCTCGNTKVVRGSSSTGKATGLTGRHFVGVEMDSGYFAIALKRLEPYRAIV